VLGIAEAQHEEVEPQGTCLVVNQLTCSLVGQMATLQVAPGSRAAALYGKGEVTVSYLCHYGNYAVKPKTSGLGYKALFFAFRPCFLIAK